MVRTTAVTRTAGAATLLVLSGLLAACGGDDEASDSPAGTDSSESTGSTGSTAGGAESEDADESPDADETPDEVDEVTADTPPTPPGTVLDPDQPAVVSLPYQGRGRGVYTVELVSVAKRPASDIPADAGALPGDTLYFVTQDWTMIDQGSGSVTGMNLLSHTSVSVGQDVQIGSVPFADFPDCRVAQFIPEDGDSGKTRRSCTAYLVPEGDVVKQVWYFEFRSEYDYSTGGSAVRWPVDVPES